MTVAKCEGWRLRPRRLGLPDGRRKLEKMNKETRKMKKVSQGSELTGDFPDTAPEPRSQNSETYFLCSYRLFSPCPQTHCGLIPGKVRTAPNPAKIPKIRRMFNIKAIRLGRPLTYQTWVTGEASSIKPIR